jgi:capsular exopolysaccharide synthesis family protein
MPRPRPTAIPPSAIPATVAAAGAGDVRTGRSSTGASAHGATKNPAPQPEAPQTAGPTLPPAGNPATPVVAARAPGAGAPPSGGYPVAEFSGPTEPAPQYHATPLKTLWRRKWLVVIVTVLSVAGTWFYLKRVTPIYTSTARVYVQQTMPNMKDQDVQIANGDSYLFLQAEMVRSSSVLDKVVKDPAIRSLPTIGNTDDPAGKLGGTLRVDLDPKLSILKIDCDSPFAGDVATIVNAVVEIYKTEQLQERNKSGQEVYDFLKTEKDAEDAKLADKTKKLVEFLKERKTVDVAGATASPVMADLQQINAELARATAERVKADAYLQSAMKMKDDPDRLRQFLTLENDTNTHLTFDDRAAEIEKRLEVLKSELASMDASMSNNPRVHSVQASIDSLTAELKVERSHTASQILELFQRNFDAKEGIEKGLKAHLDEVTKQALAANGDAADLMLLKSEKDRQASLCDMLDERMKKLNVDNVDKPLNVKVLTYGGTPDAPSFPKKSLFMGVALVSGITFGCLCVLLLELMDRRVRSADEVKGRLRVKILGAVPRARHRRSPRMMGQRVHVDPWSDVAEAFRAIRTAITLGTTSTGEAPIKRLLVTSPTPGDGKTVTSSNLAIAYAQNGLRTLLIDADVRRPMQQVVYGVSNDVGLSTVLTGRDRFSEAVVPSGVPGLDILPAGPCPPNPAELLGSRQFQSLLAEATRQYDQVILDTPPVLPVADARVLAACVDGTVLVLRGQKTTRRESEDALESLQAVGGRVLGVVVNDMARNDDGYSYSANYSYRPPAMSGDLLPPKRTLEHKSGSGNGSNGNGYAG